MHTRSAATALPDPHILTLDGTRYVLTLFRSCLDPAFSESGAESIFQTAAYHQALEQAPPDGMDFYYVRIEVDARVVGMLSFQLKSFNPGVSLRNQINGSVTSRIRYGLASLIEVPVLCLGNTLVTGDYGFAFDPAMSTRERARIMLRVVDWMLTLPDFRKARMVFLKDFYTDILDGLEEESGASRYYAIDTQPNMILDVDPAWGDLSGYLRALKSKYRVRARRALRLASGLTCEELNLDQIRDMEAHLHGLYLKVAADVGFNLFTLSPQYFTSLKQALGDRFRLWVYRENAQVISFFTVIEDGEWLDAHFLGYDPDVNHRYQLYLNMLLRMIDQAARRGFQKLQLSRTATEIKSSVGAQGVRMWAYMRHTRKPVNRLFPHLYRFFQPDMRWTPRSPFHVDGDGLSHDFGQDETMD